MISTWLKQEWDEKEHIRLSGAYEAPNLFLYACYVFTSIQNKGWYVKFSSTETMVSECFLIPYYKTLKLFLRFLLSITISGDTASDFLDMKMLIGSVTYLKQHLWLGKTTYLS